MGKRTHTSRIGQDSAYGRRLSRPDKNTETTIGRRISVLPNGCWAYKGRLDRYGNTTASEGRIIAHRFVYETLVGPIPDGYHLHHECENPGCCNPRHLLPLSPADHRRRHIEMRSR